MKKIKEVLERSRVSDLDHLDPVFLPGSGFQLSLDPVPTFKYLRGLIRIRFVPRGWIRIRSISDRIHNLVHLYVCPPAYISDLYPLI